MTDAEKVEALQSAIRRADRVLDWILADGGHAEWMLTTAKRVRRILQAALKKTGDGPHAGQAPGQALNGGSSADAPSAERKAPQTVMPPKVKLGRRAIESMIDDGIIKTNRRKRKGDAR